MGSDVAVRDSKDQHGPTLRFTSRKWQAFLGGVRDGVFDRDQVVTFALGVATAHAIFTGKATEATAATLAAFTALQVARHRHLR